MKSFPLPNTDLFVSPLALGAAEWGTDISGPPLDALLGAYLAAGGNFVDTAHCYAFWKAGGAAGSSEREVGAALRRLGATDKVIVATKGGHPADAPRYPRPDMYLSPDVLRRDIAESLEHLGRERIDLYYLHRDDPQAPVSEIIEVLNEEIGAGRLRYLGASNWPTRRIAEANEYAAAHGLQGFAVSQVQESLATPNKKPSADPTTRFLLPEDEAFYAQNNIAVVAYSATASGYFAGKERANGQYDNAENQARRERARQIANEKKATPTQIALAYLRHLSPVVVPLFSTLNPAHLAEAVASTSLLLTADEAAYLRGEPSVSGS